MMKKNSQEEHTNQNNKINELEENNKNLQEKLKLLRIQLMSQSQLQFASFSHSRSASLNRSRTNLHSSRHFHSTTGLKADDHAKPSPRKNPESILHQLSILQEELDSVKEQHKNRISELEKQISRSENAISPTKLKLELNENVELIKLKRLSKKQSAQILSLQSQLESSNTELKQLQTNLLSVTNDKDHLQAEFSNEKCENAKLLSDISTMKENSKFLEEQINDLQKEKATLKEHNENLLKLSLQQKSISTDSNKPDLLKQIKELQDNLQKEILAKSELSSKLSDTELSIVKYKNEIAENNLLISDLKTTNNSMENEVKKLRSSLINDNVLSKSRSEIVCTQDKSVMAVPEREYKNSSSTDNDLPTSSNMNDRDESSLKIQLYAISQELSQCKELLRVQYGLNNKYKKEVEELQKIFQKNEKLSSENLRSFQNILRRHEEHLSKIRNFDTNEHLKLISTELNRIFSVKKLGSYHDYINCFEKLLASYILLVKNSVMTSDRLPSEEKGTVIDNLICNVDKTVQVEVKKEIPELSDDDKSVVAPNLIGTTEKILDRTKSVVFELRIKRASFDHFSDHLLKSTGNNPRIFLTWNFLDDNEHQAYTPTIAVKEGVFDCSCQYEGPWSEFLHQYLKQHGIRVEIHLVQGDISVRLAETKIDTSSAFDYLDKFQEFCSLFHNDNIKGNVTGTFILRCCTTIEKIDQHFS